MGERKIKQFETMAETEPVEEDEGLLSDNLEKGQEENGEDFSDVSEREQQGNKQEEDVLKPENQETFRESINNVAEFLIQWEKDYKQTDNYEVKRELAYRILRMNMALNASRLNAETIKIRECGGGTLGFYVPATGEIAITPEGLDLPAEHYSDVLVHESAHAGKLTGRRIMDEGMAELETISRVPGAMKEIYAHEQHQAKDAFAEEGMTRALRTYDFDHPTRLAKMYLEVEVEDRWRSKIKTKLKQEKLKKPVKRDKFLEKLMKESVPDIEKQFEKGVPDLHEKLRAEGFSFKRAELEILKRLYNKK